MNNPVEIDHPIVALATPKSKSALAIVRITGKNCISLFSNFLPHTHMAIESWNANTTHLAQIVNPKNSELLDEAIICVYHAPHSFTGQDSIEISLHGSPIGIDKLLLALTSNGFTMAEPGEFTKRAFLSGKIDLTQAEAIQTLIEAHSSESHAQALVQLSGGLTDFINRLKTKILKLVAKLRVCLDYPEDEIQDSTEISEEEIQTIVESLTQSIHSYELLRQHREGYICIIAGLTNAGKSSLYNCLLKEERSIVSSTHGTTRDFIETSILLRGKSIRIFDTAGLRLTEEDIEQKGIHRSYTLIQSANLILYIIDASVGLQDEDNTQLSWILSNVDLAVQHTIIVWNKLDLLSHSHRPQNIEITLDGTRHVFEHSVMVSSNLYENIDLLQEYMLGRLDTSASPIHEDMSHISSLRQKHLLEECKHSLLHVCEGIQAKIPLDMISLDMDKALSCLGEITGEIHTEDILDTIFSEFCLGK